MTHLVQGLVGGHSLLRCQLTTLLILLLLLRSFLQESKRIIVIVIVVSCWLRLSGLFPLIFGRLLFLIYNSQRIISASKSIQHVIEVVSIACGSWLLLWLATPDAVVATHPWLARGLRAHRVDLPHSGVWALLVSIPVIVIKVI